MQADKAILKIDILLIFLGGWWIIFTPASPLQVGISLFGIELSNKYRQIYRADNSGN